MFLMDISDIRHMKKNNKSKILVYFVSGKEVGSADSELSKGSADAAWRKID